VKGSYSISSGTNVIVASYILIDEKLPGYTHLEINGTAIDKVKNDYNLGLLDPQHLSPGLHEVVMWHDFPEPESFFALAFV